ncbi:F0F1 ATP synthase subunit alpha, partial [Candidatus Saccharibacteria bacterium]|nr:F0F1 ATP synthase subunit alpha [Candidatus Saccharibacteria bacterium]
MPELSVTDLSKEIKDAIQALEVSGDLESVGVVTRVGDGVAWVYGLRAAGYSEVLLIETDEGVVEAFALNLNEDEIGAVLLGSDESVVAGSKVTLKGTVLDVPVGPELLGRVV